MAEKARAVLGEMERRMGLLGFAWKDATAVQLYTVFNIYTPAESGVRQALFTDAVFVSDQMRHRLHDAYGERECGWHES